MRYAVVTLDLEPDYAGHCPDVTEGWKLERVKKLIGFVRKYKIPISVFVVSKLLSKKADSIELLKNYGCDFHLHSFSHSLEFPDSREEIDNGIQAYQKFFKHKPVGYRAPEGRISVEGWKYLDENKFEFDASVFPSFWPRPGYLKYSVTPFIVSNTRILEIPFATVSPFRLIVSLSWIKLLGWETYSVLIRIFGLSDIVIFNIHMHDLELLPVYSSLPQFWKYIYARNHSNSYHYFSKMINLLQAKGYTFTTISRVVQSLRDNKNI